MSFSHISIPVTFEWQGKTYHGAFGAPDVITPMSWQLMIDEHYYGKLVRVNRLLPGMPAVAANYVPDFQFYGVKDMFNDLSDYFEAVVIAWYS